MTFDRTSLHQTFAASNDARTAPMWNLDLDGNVVVGYKVINPSKMPPLGPNDDKAHQDIPRNANIEALVASGAIAPEIFAAKDWDVRLPKKLVETLNAEIAAGRPFTITFNTSRPSDEVDFVLRASGVEHPEKVVYASNSGARIQVDGKLHIVREVTPEETAYLKQAGDLLPALNQHAMSLLQAEGRDISTVEPLWLQNKGTGINVHYRKMFDPLGLEEEHGVGEKIAHHVAKTLDDYAVATGSPRLHGKPALEALPGPMTHEIKIQDINKSKGVQLIVEAAKRHGLHPKLLVFGGDDLFANKKNAQGEHVEYRYGTDKPAADYVLAKLEGEHDIKGAVLHTLHPTGRIAGNPADPTRVIPSTSPLHPSRGGISVSTVHPAETAEYVADSVLAMQKAIGPGNKISEMERKSVAASRQL